MSEMSETDEIRLMFANSESTKKLIPELETKGLERPSIENAIVSLEMVTKWFKAFHVESIELTIEGSVKTGNLLTLFVSGEGKGGMKVVLKPNTVNPE